MGRALPTGVALEALGRKDEAREDVKTGGRYLRQVLPAAWPGLNAEARATVVEMQKKFREYGVETPRFEAR